MDILKSNLSSIGEVIHSMETNLQVYKDDLNTSRGAINGEAFTEELQKLSGIKFLIFSSIINLTFQDILMG